VPFCCEVTRCKIANQVAEPALCASDRLYENWRWRKPSVGPGWRWDCEGGDAATDTNFSFGSATRKVAARMKARPRFSMASRRIRPLESEKSVDRQILHGAFF